MPDFDPSAAGATAVSVADFRTVLERHYPPALAEKWDTGIGLTCGDPDQPVRTVLLAVDLDNRTVDEADQLGADLIITHHPLLFRAVQSIAADTAKGRLLHRLIRSGIAHFAAHTNADRAAGGVNDALAQVLGLREVRPLEPADGPALDKLAVMVPREAAETLINALTAAGAGQVGDYSHAAFSVDGLGQFLPMPGAEPAIGRVGRLERVLETRIEMVVPRPARRAVLAALQVAHPYEEPGFDLTETIRIPSSTTGLGRIGVLGIPMSAVEFARHVARSLPTTVTGARLAGDPDRLVESVAVCGGAGGSLLETVAAAGVDAYVTADLSHHVAAEYVDVPGHPVLVDVAHWASEWPWLPLAARMLSDAFGDAVAIVVSDRCTDPWRDRF